MIIWLDRTGLVSMSRFIFKVLRRLIRVIGCNIVLSWACNCRTILHIIILAHLCLFLHIDSIERSKIIQVVLIICLDIVLGNHAILKLIWILQIWISFNNLLLRHLPFLRWSYRQILCILSQSLLLRIFYLSLQKIVISICIFLKIWICVAVRKVLFRLLDCSTNLAWIIVK